MKGEDKDRIETLTKTLGDLSGKMAERLYAKGGDAGSTDAGESHSHQGGNHDDVVDAEFEEVKDDKK